MTSSLRYKVQRSKTEVYDLVSQVLEEAHDDDGAFHYPIQADPWVEVDHGSFWGLWWTWRKPKNPKEVLWIRGGAQMVNHIPGTGQLTRKDLLKACIQRYGRGRGPGAGYFQFLPESFTLPGEYVGFTKAFAASGTTSTNTMSGSSSGGGGGASSSSTTTTKSLWILKTVGMSRGRGVKVVERIEDVVYSDTCVIQKYIERPLLLQGRKFDLRLYVVVTGFSPLECFISTLGFARLATQVYNHHGDYGNKAVHLTNTAVAAEARRNASEGINTKWPLEKVKAHLEHEGLLLAPDSSTLAAGSSGSKLKPKDSTTSEPLPVEGLTWAQVWDNICSVVLASLTCAEDNITTSTPCTFELLGYDVMLDSSFKPWLLEVNASPSLECYDSVDQWMKPLLMKEIIELVNPMRVDVPGLIEVLQDRLKKGGTTATKKHAGGGGSSRSASALKNQLNVDFNKIFHGSTPRLVGEAPSELGHFQQLAPSKQYQTLLKAKKRAF